MGRFTILLALMIWINTVTPLAGEPAGGDRGVHFMAAESQNPVLAAASRSRSGADGGTPPGNCPWREIQQYASPGSARSLFQVIRAPEHLLLLTAVIHGSKYKPAGILCTDAM